MTDLQRKQIKLLRLQGISYVKIGEMLGISDNTVRSFCRRNPMIGGKFSVGRAAVLCCEHHHKGPDRCAVYRISLDGGHDSVVSVHKTNASFSKSNN